MSLKRGNLCNLPIELFWYEILPFMQVGNIAFGLQNVNKGFRTITRKYIKTLDLGIANVCKKGFKSFQEEVSSTISRKDQNGIVNFLNHCVKMLMSRKQSEYIHPVTLNEYGKLLKMGLIKFSDRKREGKLIIVFLLTRFLLYYDSRSSRYRLDRIDDLLRWINFDNAKPTRRKSENNISNRKVKISLRLIRILFKLVFTAHDYERIEKKDKKLSESYFCCFSKLRGEDMYSSEFESHNMWELHSSSFAKLCNDFPAKFRIPTTQEIERIFYECKNIHLFRSVIQNYVPHFRFPKELFHVLGMKSAYELEEIKKDDSYGEYYRRYDEYNYSRSSSSTSSPSCDFFFTVCKGYRKHPSKFRNPLKMSKFLYYRLISAFRKRLDCLELSTSINHKRIEKKYSILREKATILLDFVQKFGLHVDSREEEVEGEEEEEEEKDYSYKVRKRRKRKDTLYKGIRRVIDECNRNIEVLKHVLPRIQNINYDFVDYYDDCYNHRYLMKTVEEWEYEEMRKWEEIDSSKSSLTVNKKSQVERQSERVAMDFEEMMDWKRGKRSKKMKKKRKKRRRDVMISRMKKKQGHSTTSSKTRKGKGKGKKTWKVVRRGGGKSSYHVSEQEIMMGFEIQDD